MVNAASSIMRRVAARLSRSREVERLTLLELIATVGETTEDDAEVVATVTHMLRSGAVMLRGNFRGEPARRFCD